MKFENMINTIQLGNCYELIKDIPDKSIDLVIIDPPYEITNGVHTSGFLKNRNELDTTKQIFEKKLEIGIKNDILNELIRVMRKINIYIWCNKKQLLQYLSFFENYNVMFECIIWNKYNCIPLTYNTYLPDKEYCLYFKEKGITLNNTYETSKTVYSIPINVADKKIYKHPTIKPLEIVKNTILNSSKENDIVLDCFCGSGTTCLAAKETGRRYIGMEIDPEYHKIAVNRLNGITAQGQISIFTDTEQIKEEK
ncbi:MAG: DNA methyltransferase [Bacilli bacterium]|nr:DNA methyltransferase [Bacilli bacterium]